MVRRAPEELNMVKDHSLQSISKKIAGVEDIEGASASAYDGIGKGAWHFV